MEKSPVRILVVEDEAIVALDIQGHLEALGYSVSGLCSSSQQALDAVASASANGLLPDIILMDINLKGDIDGIETALKMKTIYDLPVIFITAYADEQTLNRAKYVEPLGYLIKPFDITRLESTLEIALYKHSMEKRLRESEYRYRLISELVSDFAFSIRVLEDNSLEMEWMTDAYTHLTGYAADSINAHTFLQTTILPEDRALVRSCINKTLSGETSIFEYRLVTKSGQVRWIRSSLRPTWEDSDTRVIRIVGASSDITEQKQAERKIRQLSQAVEQSPSTVVITDTNGHIQYVNPIFEELTGYSAGEVIGSYPSVLKSGEHSPEFYQTLWSDILSGKLWRGTILNRRKDGTTYWESAAISPLRDDKGNITHFIKVAADITETVRATEALQQRSEELQVMNSELDAFAHTVAHDIQGELSVIAGYSELLLEMGNDLESDTFQNAVEIINRRAHKMNDITQSLLLLASARLAEVELTAVSMSELVNEVLLRFSTSLDADVDSVKIPEAFPDALGYGPWIEEVWANYLSNAIKYGGDPVEMELGFDDECEVGFVRYWVRDNGDGLKPADLNNLFIPFSRLGLHQGIKGHGLGLSIVERIITRLGGRVGAESTGVAGEGSTFYFTLPSITRS
jgi:PAS domain S-box-containing protein